MILSDFKSDPNYGEIIFNNDLSLSYNDTVLLNIVNERLNTNEDDFRLLAENGANLQSYLGIGITETLLTQIEVSIRRALTYDDLLNTSNIDIASVQLSDNEIFTKVVINSPFTGRSLQYSTTLGTTS